MHFFSCQLFTLESVQKEINKLTMWSVFLRENYALAVSNQFSLWLNVVKSWDVHAISCLKSSIEYFCMLSERKSFVVNIKKVQRGIILAIFLKNSDINILPKNRRNNFESLFAFKDTNVSLIYKLLRFSFKIRPLC